MSKRNSAVPDTAEANAGNRNLARERLNAALESADGLRVTGVRFVNGVEASLRVSARGPISVRNNNPTVVHGRPDSTITEVNVWGISTPVASLRVHLRFAEPKKKPGD